VETVAVATEDVVGDALALTDDAVLFATGVATPDGSIRKVAKTGGNVQILASGIDTRDSLDPNSSIEVKRLVVAGDVVAFVEPFTERLSFVPLAGGAVTRSSTTAIVENGIAFDPRSSLVGVSMAGLATTASLVRIDGSGAATSTLEQWSYGEQRFAHMGSLVPAVAVVVSDTRVYWVDNGNDDRRLIRSTIRTAVLH
jgi:hypothetical protein